MLIAEHRTLTGFRPTSTASAIVQQHYAVVIWQAERPRCMLHESGFRRPMRTLTTSAAVAAIPEMATNAPEENSVVSGVKRSEEMELFSEQPLVADYQYTLRYFRALKQQIGAWKIAFMAEHRRQPSAHDAEDQCGQEFGALYGTYLEVRARLLVEVPRLKERLQGAQGTEGSSRHQHRQRGGAAAGDRGSVNANSHSSSIAGSSSGAAPGHAAHQQQPQQMVDSVSTWLRADRYRRQRTVAAAAWSAVSGGAAPASPSGLAAPAAVGAAGFLWPQQEAAPTREVDVGAEAAGAAASAAGPAQAAWLPYQPVIQLTPVEQWLQAAGGVAEAPAGGGDELWRAGAGPGGLAVAVDPLAVDSGVAQAAATLLGTSPLPGGSGSSRGSEQARELRPAASPHGQEAAQRLSHCPPALAPAVAATAGMQAPAAPRADPVASSRRLEEDAHLAGDSRAKNALFAALKYKRAGKPAAAVNGDGEGQPGEGGDGGAGSTAAVVVVVGEVQRGDAVGAYSGRVRQLEALPEAFLLCP